MKIGMSAVELVCEIARRQKSISRMRFGIYGKGKFSPLAEKLEKKAKRLRKSSRLHGYWQSILSVCWQDPAVRKQLYQAIEKACQHEKTTGGVTIFELERGQITDQRLATYIRNLAPGESLFVSSQVKLANGRSIHLPMMDFACYDSIGDLKKVVFAISAMGLGRGVVLSSGNSFHYYGYSHLSMDQWIQFLGKCLLLVPITDARYIGHRMIDGGCTLRLSAGRQSGRGPEVAAMIS
jgi:hypothetical protein